MVIQNNNLLTIMEGLWPLANKDVVFSDVRSIKVRYSWKL
jgi:hypothetical protein